MAIRKLVNLRFPDGNHARFEFDCYQFIQNHPIPLNMIHRNKRYVSNGKVRFYGLQENSIIYRNAQGVGVRGDRYGRQERRKRIDDLLIICSLITGSNWRLSIDSSSTDFPVYPINYCENLFRYQRDARIENYLKTAIATITQPSWQRQFKNGFHLRMMQSRANIYNSESRFVSYMTIWEWLYPHLRNKHGAMPDDESDNLDEIMKFVIKYYWERNINFSRGNLFKILRNQLAHSGFTPIDKTRRGAGSWMSEINGDKIFGLYVPFFEKLTQVIILKTIGINADYIIQKDKIENYLNTGNPYC